MNLIKAVFTFLVFVALAIGFFALIRFEISYGVAGGKFGAADLRDFPGTFWFFIEIQILMGLYSLVIAIKALWNFSQRNTLESDRKPPATLIGIYWLLASFLFLVLNLLAVWSAFEMLCNAYNMVDNYEMPEKAIVGGLYLLCLGVFGYLFYWFLFRSLLDTFFPKARISIETLRKVKKH